MVKPKYFSKQELEEHFELKDGLLWSKPSNRKAKSNSVASVKPQHIIGSLTEDGYRCVKFKGRQLKYHTVVWILANGDLSPNLVINHINGDKQDNRLENLEAVTQRVNTQRQARHRDGKLVGTQFRWHKDMLCWLARVTVNYKKIEIGRFKTEIEAHNAYMAYCQEHNL